jgi:uncharacterized membrane protein YgaE (UPF0421/DUF939 family)
VYTLLTAFIGGFVAWIVTTVVGQPLLRFFQLRAQAAHFLARYDDQPWIGNPETKPPAEAWLAKRREAYEEIGSELVAFADTNSFIARALHHKLLGKYRYKARYAGDDLRLLGATYPGTKAWADIHKRTRSALRLGD